GDLRLNFQAQQDRKERNYPDHVRRVWIAKLDENIDGSQSWIDEPASRSMIADQIGAGEIEITYTRVEVGKGIVPPERAVLFRYERIKAERHLEGVHQQSLVPDKYAQGE